MLKVRIIPCLDVKDGRVVKGVNFVGLRDAGDPVEQAILYDAAGADELCFLDITASHEKRGILLDVVRRTARACFMPLTVGGGVRTLDDIRALLLAGADKVSINTEAVRRPEIRARGAPRNSAANASSPRSMPSASAARLRSVHPWRAQRDRHRRRRACAERWSSSARAKSCSPRWTATARARLRPRAHARGRRCGARSGDRLGRRRHRSTIWSPASSKATPSAVLAASIFHFGEATILDAKQRLAAAGIAVRL